MPRSGLDSEAVVTAAAALADAEGLEAVTLARLAKDLGIRPPSLYVHVDGLGDLRRRIAEKAVRELAAELRAAASGRSRSDALRAVADAYRAYARAHPGSYAALQRLPTFAADGADGGGAGREVVDVVLAVLRGYGFEGDEAIHATRALRAGLHGFVALETEGGFGLPLSLDESFAVLVTIADRGLADLGA